VKVWHDRGEGITEKSKKHFEKRYKQVIPIEVVVSNFGVFTFQLYGIHRETHEPIVILESGFNCGYRGTGPHGTVWALELLGVPKSYRALVFSLDRLVIDFRTKQPRVVA